MDNLVLYCKSYRGDFDRLLKLYHSIVEHNVDNLRFFVSVPEEDMEAAQKILPYSMDTRVSVNLWSDQALVREELPSSWLTQQLVKASFWKLGDIENYVCLDSDSYFIKDFTKADFMYDEDTPYTVCHEQKELWNWSTGKEGMLGHDPKISFTEDRQKIMHHFERSGGVVLDFGPSPVIWSAKVWKWLDELLEENNTTLYEALQDIPSEFTWYGEALLYSEVIRLVPREPLFKVFHYSQQYEEYKRDGVPLEHIAKNYMGIVLQSNNSNTMEY